MAIVNRTLTAFFQDGEGNKIAGLPASVTIFNVTNGARIQVGVYAMPEMTIGLYAYTYPSFDTEKEYIFIFDGGASLDNIIRYKIAGVNGQENIENPLQEILNTITDITATASIITQPS